MKKTALLLAVALLVGSAAAVTNYSGPEDQPHIMAGPSEPSKTTTGPNSSWSFDVVQTNATCMSGNESVSDITVTQDSESYSLNFTGTLKSATPCHSLVHNVEVDGSTYKLNITSEASNRTCIDCIGGLDYMVQAQLPKEEFTLQVYHDGKQIKEITRTPEPEQSETGFFQKIVGFFASLF